MGTTRAKYLRDSRNELYWHDLMKAVHRMEQYTHLVLISKNSNFPRQQRYYLCKEINDSVERIMTGAVKIKKGYGTASVCQNMDVEIDKLRYRIHECAKNKYVRIQRAHHWGLLVNTVGKLLGAMMQKKK